MSSTREAVWTLLTSAAGGEAVAVAVEVETGDVELEAEIEVAESVGGLDDC